MKYLVSHQGRELGPLAIDEIVGKVRGKELELFDYLFDESRGDWILLMEFPQVAEQLKSSKPPRPTLTEKSGAKASDSPPPLPEVKARRPPATDAHNITEWFVLKGENRFGPFTYTDLIKMLQQKVVFPFDYIWHSGMTSWERMAALESFQPETIRELHANSGKSKDVFSERRFLRKKFNGRVIVHNNLSVWKGEGFEISRGGVGVCMSNSIVVPGQQVVVHFTRTEEWPALNAVCEVVSKKFVSDDSPVQYGLRFLSLSQEVQEEFYKKVA